MQQRIATGKRVFVPFGGRKLTAYILAVFDRSNISGLKKIIDILDDDPLWTDNELEFFRWIASYYLHPLGEVLKTALPTGINLQSTNKTGKNGPIVSGGKSVRREFFYRPNETPPSSPVRGNKLIEILKVIREAGDLPAAELRKRFGQCSQQLKRLLELGLVTREEREVYRNPFSEELLELISPRHSILSRGRPWTRYATSLDNPLFAPFLLHGVTGSGKTEVYLQAIAHALDQGDNALVLVPEISLTPQLVRRFRARFGGGIAVLHSALSDGERYDEWRRIRRGLVRIVIGARSAALRPAGTDRHHRGGRGARGILQAGRRPALQRPRPGAGAGKNGTGRGGARLGHAR